MKTRLIICLFLLLSLRGYSQCTLAVSISSSSPTICSGNNVTLTANLTGGTGPFTYAWLPTGETSSSINVNKAGTYTVTVSDNTPGCSPVKESITIAASPTPDAPTVAPVAPVCLGNPVTLTATAPGGNYQWYDAATGGNLLANGATYTTPPITAPTLFYVETTVGGCTSARTAVAVTLNGKPTIRSASICSDNVAVLSASGGTSYTWYDKASGGNVVSTTSSFTTPVLTVTTTYYVVVVSNGCTSAPTPVTAFVTPPPQAPTASNQTICSGQTILLHADAPSGIFNWYTTPVGGTSLISSPDYTTPPLTANTTYYVENSINDCVSPRTPVTVTISPNPPPPVSQTDSVCYGTSASLQASATPTGTYQWYDAISGGNLLATGNTYTTPVLNSSTTYYVLNNNGGCISTRATIDVIVKPQLPVPSVAGAIICPGTVTTLTATSPGGTYSWFNVATGGTALFTGDNYTTQPINANTTYYVQTTINGCTSPRAAVIVTVLPKVTPPTAPPVTICSGTSATLSASGSADGYAWYDAPTGGNLLSSAQVYVTPVLTTNNTYYVEATGISCSSSRRAVKVTIAPDPTVPTISGNTTVCPGTSTSLTATANGTIRWYDVPTGGSVIKSNATFNTPALLVTTTYYAENTTGPCSSTRTPVTVTVTNVPNPQFKYPTSTFCAKAAGTVTPTVYNPAGGVFSAAPAGLIITPADGTIDIGNSAPGTYIVSFASNGVCPNTTNARIVINNTIVSAVFSYGGPYCQDSPNPLPTFGPNASGGIFTSTPAGLVFLNETTGEIDVANSKSGSYSITNSISAAAGCGSDVYTYPTPVTILEKVSVDAGPDQTVASGSPVTLSGSVTGASTNGTWSGGTGSFTNANQPNGAVYTPGPGETEVTLVLTSDNPPGPCGQHNDRLIVTFVKSPTAPVANGTTICSGNVAILSATSPGGTYAWYDAATGGNLQYIGPSFTTPPLTVNTTYYVQTTVNGITTSRTPVPVTINAVPDAPTAPGMPTCKGSPVTLTASGSTGTYEWYDAPLNGTLLSTNSTYTTPAITNTTSYYVQTTVNGCISPRTKVDVTASPVPVVTSKATGNICGGIAQDYVITSDIAAATFSWSRIKVAGISNPAVTNQTDGTITEALINTTGAAINVTYIITPIVGTCSGAPFNYTVTVYPSPTVTSAPAITICNTDVVGYAVTFNTPGINFSWARAAVTGISNAAVTGQTAGTIKEVLFNTTADPIQVNYVFTYKTGTCAGVPFTLVVTVNPTPVITSSATGIACTGTAQNYVIQSNVTPATYVWSRAAVPNVSNPPASNQTSGTITEDLINTGPSPVDVIYAITPTANTCPGTPFKYTVTVNPPLSTPVANSDHFVCSGNSIHLLTNPVANATYLWTGPNGFTSTAQNPVITNTTAANAGTYTLIVNVNGCDSRPATTDVEIDQVPTVYAGPDTLVCIDNIIIKLDSATISGVNPTGIWSTSGTGNFSFPLTTINNAYQPSPADKAAGSVKLTLTSTGKSDCNFPSSSFTITFGPVPAVIAGAEQDICSQDNLVQLAPKLIIPTNVMWTTSGTGHFIPQDGSNPNSSYVPSADDKKKGSVELTLNVVNPGKCYDKADSVLIKFIPPPKVTAERVRYVLRGNTITLNPVINESDLTYLWSPDVDISDVNVKNPVITGDIDRFYVLTVTDKRGCVTIDTTYIKVSPEIKVNNTFTPNGDGINDLWNITGLVAYVDATVDIYNRYGQKLFHSIGYPKAWDGTYNGSPVPSGVYYYVIDTKVNNQVLSGYITVIR